jgi:hypothetical protein
MAKINWTVQPVNEGYQGFVKVNSAVLSEEPFASKIAAQMAAEDAAYRLGVKLAAKVPNTLPSDIVIDRV